MFNRSTRRKRERMDLRQYFEKMISDNPLIQETLQNPSRINKTNPQQYIL